MNPKRIYDSIDSVSTVYQCIALLFSYLVSVETRLDPNPKRLYNDNNEDNDEDEQDWNDDHRDEGQIYQVPWDMEEEEAAHGAISVEWSQEDATFASEEQHGSFSRDEDAILTEREDRLYVDENGNRVKVERCILVGVEDLAAMRKSRRNAFAQPQQQRHQHNQDGSNMRQEHPEEMDFTKLQ